ncbi:MAG: PAS domain S-box protein, partial [Thermoanaerobaculia bacterium]
LTRSEMRKAAILDSSLDCIVTVDHEGRITEFNPAAERTFGYSRENLVGKPLIETLVPPSLRERHRREFARFLTGESRWLGRRVETSALCADGSEIPIELAITRTHSEGGPSFTGFVRDITDRKRAIEQRNWAETQLAGEKRLLEMIASGRSLTDVLTALCWFVEEAADDCICGVYPIDWSGPFFHSGVAPSLPASYVGPIEGLAVRCDVAPCGIAALTKTQVIVADMESDPQWQGTPYRDHVLGHGLRSVWSTPIYALDGHILGTFVIYQRKPARPSPRQMELIAHVTHIASIALERAQAESALKRSEAFLVEGERLSLTGTFSWRVTTGEITWSEQVHRIFEADPRVPATLDLIRERLHPDDMHLFQEMVDRARTDASGFEFEHRLQMPGGAVKYLRVVAHPMRDHDGRLEYIGAVQDVTSLRRSEEALGKVRSELAHVARASSLGTLTASIAHEVNQPLCGVVTNASTCLRMLDADPPNIDGARETARRMIRDGHRASEVITRLRALFSNKGGPLESVDINEATREVIALSRSELQRNRVVLQSSLADDLPTVKGDRVQLQQVILNLLLNACDAMSGVDDRVRQAVITTQGESGGGIRVTVRDAGCGLPRQAIEKIFEPFFSTKNEGMGIGLTVSRSIIERHRGRIWAAPNDGPGTTFAFSIPEGH